VDIRDLRGFVWAGDLLHFGQAADRLHVTQSALSKQIQRLEAEIGGALFERNTTRTRLTPLGRALHEEARTLVESLAGFSRRARNAALGVLGTLRIGFGDAAKTLAPVAIARFRALRPEVQIELAEMSARHQIEAMRAGTLDLGFCRLPAPRDWPALPVVRAGLVAVLPDAYPAASTLADLGDHPLVTIQRARAPAFHDHVLRYLDQIGLRVQSMQTVSQFSTAVALAEAGVAWAIVPSSTAFDGLGARMLAMEDPRAQWEIGLVRPPGEPGRLVAAFWAGVEALRAEEGAFGL
jgi:DNA-binding transcriptional LysR family regulator